MSGIPGVWVLLVPSPGPVAAKVTWQGAAADGSRSARPDGPLCTRFLCWLLLKVRHHEWCWEAKCSSCQWQIWNTKAGMTRKWKEKMFPLAAENVRQCLIDSQRSERLDAFLELGAFFLSARSKSNFALALCCSRFIVMSQSFVTIASVVLHTRLCFSRHQPPPNLAALAIAAGDERPSASPHSPLPRGSPVCAP